MSAKASFWAWAQPIKPASAKLVLLCLANCHNGDRGQCNPSVRHIAEQTGLDRKTVIKSLSTLEDLGLISAFKTNGYCPEYILRTSTENGTPPYPKNGTGTYPKNGTPPYTVFPQDLSQKRDPPYPKNGTRTYKEPKRNLIGESTRTRSIDLDLEDTSWAH